MQVLRSETTRAKAAAFLSSNLRKLLETATTTTTTKAKKADDKAKANANAKANGNANAKDNANANANVNANGTFVRQSLIPMPSRCLDEAGKPLGVVESLDRELTYVHFVRLLGLVLDNPFQAAVAGSFVQGSST